MGRQKFSVLLQYLNWYHLFIDNITISASFHTLLHSIIVHCFAIMDASCKT